MTPSQLQRMVHQIAQMEQKIGNMIRVGTVDEVKGNKMRMKFGKDADGKDVLGPYVHTGSNMRGNTKESHGWAKGQNIMMISPTGDPRQAAVMPYAPNDENKQPGHAGNNEDEHNFEARAKKDSSGGGQGGGGGSGEKGTVLRGKQKHDGWNHWLEEEEDEQGGGQQQGEGGGGGGGNSKDDDQKMGQGRTGGDKAIVSQQMNKKHGVTNRFGKDARMNVQKKGTKIEMKDGNYAEVTEKRSILKSTKVNKYHAPRHIFNTPPVVQAFNDQTELENDPDKQQSSSGQGQGQGQQSA